MSSETPELERQLASLRERVDELAEEVRALRSRDAERAESMSRSALVAGRGRAEEVLYPDLFNLHGVLPPSPQRTPATIIGGEETDEFPDCCAVGNAIGYYCSGALIAPRLAVTAGHCTGVTRVFLKGSDIDVPADGETITVTETIRHPDVDLRVLVLAHDSTVRPRRIERTADLGNPTEARLVGFGAVNLAGTMDYGKKRTVDVPIKSLDCGTPEEANEFACVQGLEIISGHRGFLKGNCTGDSGGPLYISAQDGSFRLLGVISRPIKNPANVCGDAGVSVRLDKFIDWIQGEIGVDLSTIS